MSLDFLEILGRRKKIKYHKVGSGQIWPPHLWQVLELSSKFGSNISYCIPEIDHFCSRRVTRINFRLCFGLCCMFTANLTTPIDVDSNFLSYPAPLSLLYSFAQNDVDNDYLAQTSSTYPFSIPAKRKKWVYRWHGTGAGTSRSRDRRGKT